MRKIFCTLICLVLFLSACGETVQAREAPTYSTIAPKASYTKPPVSVKAETQTCPCKNAAKADFVFLIDVTGSMGWCIESVKTNLQAFSASLISQGVDARFAVIEFSDAINYPGSTKVYQLEGGSYWTSNVNLLEAGLDKAIQEQYSNPGWDETPNDACYTLLNRLSSTFRSDASRFAFLMTDEGNNVVASDPRLKDMGTYASMLKNRDIHTSVVSLESLRGDFEVLCTATGGMYIDLSSSDYYKVMLSVADWVAEVTGLTVHVMERASLSDNDNNGSPSTPNLICDARKAGGYYDGNGSRITEKKLANITNPDTYTRSGYTADGNTRLVIRVQHNRPGNVYFDVGSEFGTLETLDRKKIDASTAVKTTEIQPGKLYQASAVLVAPESFPIIQQVTAPEAEASAKTSENDGFPKRDFNLNVKFDCGCGDANCTCGTEEKNISLDIYATPVVFIHGIYGDFSGTFIGENGIFRELDNNDVVISYWNYTKTEGPTSQIINKVAGGGHSGLFVVINGVCRRMLKQYNVACTRADIICHSMGGLMARTFLEYEDKSSVRSYCNSMMRRLITVATPHEGSPMTTYLLGNAEDMPYIADPNSDKSNHHSGKKYGIIVAALKNNKVLSLVRAGVRKMMKVDEDAISAWTDLALGSNLVQDLKNQGVPPVPTHVIYGTIASVLDKAILVADIAGTINDFLDILPPPMKTLLEVSTAVLENTDAFFEVVFNNEDYDTAVGESSAVSIFKAAYMTHKDGALRFNHNSICKQSDVGKEVLNLLKGNLSKFDTSGVGKSSSSPSSLSESHISAMQANSPVPVKTASASAKIMASDDVSSDDYFLTKYTLRVQTAPYTSQYTAPATLTADGSRDITFTLTAEDPAENNIYLSIGNENGGFFLQMTSADDTLRTFTASVTLPSEYPGTMSVHAFSSPNAADEGHVYISETLNINIAPVISYSDPIQELSFMGNGVILAGKSYDIGLNLFAVTTEGRYIDVSVPAVANKLRIYSSFADSSIAELTEDGKIRGLKSGSTTFTARYNSLTASTSIDVDVKYEMSPIPEATSKDLFITTLSLQDGKAGLSPYCQVFISNPKSKSS